VPERSTVVWNRAKEDAMSIALQFGVICKMAEREERERD